MFFVLFFTLKHLSNLSLTTKNNPKAIFFKEKKNTKEKKEEQLK